MYRLPEYIKLQIDLFYIKLQLNMNIPYAQGTQLLPHLLNLLSITPLSSSTLIKKPGNPNIFNISKQV
jgi:hypothetical protein